MTLSQTLELCSVGPELLATSKGTSATCVIVHARAPGNSRMISASDSMPCIPNSN